MKKEKRPACEMCEEKRKALAREVDASLAAEFFPPVSQPEEAPPAPPSADVVDVRFRPNGKIYYFDPDGLNPKTGDEVILDTARGPEFGVCASGVHHVDARDVVAPLRKLLRLATDRDREIVAANREREKTAFAICQQKIAEHQLEMQLISAEYAFDGSKILFFFTADGRVDFRDLVKNLAATFRTRIELRQIGVRDKAKMVGGLGVCGKEFCCTQFMDEFQPVSIKMAKTQNLSLNPGKISGTCGRLMCCLKYEQEAYEDLIHRIPRPESIVDTPDGRGTVCDVNLLRQTVRVRLEDRPEAIETYKNDEIAVLRNGKARKGDPPIPKELAPISGGKPRRKPAEEPPESIPAEDNMHNIFRKLDDYAAGPQPERQAQAKRRRQQRPEGAQNAGPRPAEQSDEPFRQNMKKNNYRRKQRRPYKPRPNGAEGSGRAE